MSTIRNANIATIAAQYTQEYRTPYGPNIAFLSTRLSMKRLSTSAQPGSTAVRSGRRHARPQPRIRQPRLRNPLALQRTRTARWRALLLLARRRSGGAEPQARPLRSFIPPSPPSRWLADPLSSARPRFVRRRRGRSPDPAPPGCQRVEAPERRRVAPKFRRLRPRSSVKVKSVPLKQSAERTAPAPRLAVLQYYAARR